MADELQFRIVARRDLQPADCPWFDPAHHESDARRDQVLLAYAGDECVSYAVFEGPGGYGGGDIELKFVENAPRHHRRGFAFRTIEELIRRFPDRLVWAVDAHPRAPILLRRAGFLSPDDVRHDRGGFRIGDAWVRFPAE
ncbi:MAG: hypothetical protein LAO51_03360 [Acidobacteriia bacterium]|nr:hypothetical protein [Terriglobia bacterium]